MWKTAIDVQQHFNQLELQIRNFAVTLLAAVVGAMAFAFKEHYVVSFGAARFSVAVPILCAGNHRMVGVLFHGQILVPSSSSSFSYPLGGNRKAT